MSNILIFAFPYNQNMKIISWNTNGIRSTHKQGNFFGIFEKENPDIVCLQETKALKEQLSDEILHIPHYESYFVSSQTRKGYSGVAIYTKIKPKRIEYLLGDKEKELDMEGRTLILYFDTWVLINCYFPNGGGGDIRLSFKLRFYEAFLKKCQKIRKEGYEIIFTGDVNTAHNEIDLARPKENENNTGFLPIERAWIDTVIKNGYVDTFRKLYPEKKDVYTYWDQKTRARTRNVGWRIDYFFVTENLMNSVVDTYMMTDYLGSDHCPIVLTTKKIT